MKQKVSLVLSKFLWAYCQSDITECSLDQFSTCIFLLLLAAISGARYDTYDSPDYRYRVATRIPEAMLLSLVLIESDLKFATRKRELARSFSLEKCEVVSL